MQNTLLQSIDDAIRAVEQLKNPAPLAFLEGVVQAMALCFSQGNKVIIAGNGGSLCDGAHFAEELTGIFRKVRPALPAIVLSEPGHLTCVANDLGFEHVFARGVQAFGKPGDLFIGLTTSGNSQNLVLAVETARKQGLKVILFLGKGGGALKGYGDFELLIEEFSTSDRIQEAHMVAIHILIEMVEKEFFSMSSPNVFQIPTQSLHPSHP